MSRKSLPVRVHTPARGSPSVRGASESEEMLCPRHGASCRLPGDALQLGQSDQPDRLDDLHGPLEKFIRERATRGPAGRGRGKIFGHRYARSSQARKTGR